MRTKIPQNTVKPSPIPSESPITPKAPLASSSSEEGSSLMSNDSAGADSCHLKRSPSSLMQDKLDHRSQSTLKSRIRDSPYRMSIKRDHLFRFFKWSLIGFNSILILLLIIGLFIKYFEIRENNIYKLNDEPSFGDADVSSSSSGKYSILAPLFVLGLLLPIPCFGFIGALKEHICLLILYGVMFLLMTFVTLIFKSAYFFIFAFITSASFGLVFLIGNTEETYDSTDEINSKNGSKYKIKWEVNAV